MGRKGRKWDATLFRHSTLDDLWYYDPGGSAWFAYGQARVGADGRGGMRKGLGPLISVPLISTLSTE